MSSKEQSLFMFALGVGVIFGTLTTALLSWLISVPAWVAMISPLGAAGIILLTDAHVHSKERRNE